MHPDPERSTMSRAYQTRDQASGHLAEPPCPLQQRVRTRNLILSSRSFTDLSAVEGGFFYEEVRGHKTNADRSKESGNGVAACGTGKEGGIAYNGSASVVFIEEDQLFAPGERIKFTSVLKNVSPTALFGSSAGQRACA